MKRLLSLLICLYLVLTTAAAVQADETFRILRMAERTAVSSARRVDSTSVQVRVHEVPGRIVKDGRGAVQIQERDRGTRRISRKARHTTRQGVFLTVYTAE